MSVFIVSEDMDAADSLRAALTRLGQPVVWEQGVTEAVARMNGVPPLVLVTDAALGGYAELISNLINQDAPWSRIYVMGEPGVRSTESRAQDIAKPFDAAELAALLVREHALAELERGRHNLQAHVDELALLVEASFEAIVGLGRDGTIRSWNPGAEAAYGYTAQEIVGKHIDVLEVEPDAAFERLQTDAEQVVEARRRRKDGREILVLLSLSKVARKGVSSFGFAEVSLDITERRKLERELEHAERLAAIGRIAASMAHEINNPLAVIHASTAYIRELAEQSGDPELADCTRDMAIAVERIGSFVQHVCGFSRRERPQLSDTGLSNAVDIALRMVRPRAIDQSVHIHVEDGPPARVPHDPPRLAQAILNLLSNAIDAAAMGGRNVTLRVIETQGFAHVQVDDDGPGISPEIAASMFEPFRTTKAPGQGTGLGLAITRQILGDHGGTVTVLPRAEGGARAELSIPSFDPASRRVFVLDGDPSVRRALAADLRREGFEVFTAGTLASACEMLHGKTVHVIISEVRLPDAEHSTVIQALSKACPTARRVLVTRDAEMRGVPGADAMFAKPWDRARLINTVRQLCVTDN